MTTIAFRVDGVEYSNNVLQADIWRESLSGIGRWEVLLDPLGANWLGTFTIDQNIIIDIDGVRMMEGYIDDVEPLLDDKGVFTILYRLYGRDYGMDLAQLYLSADYVNMRADDMVQAALLATGSEIRFVSPSAAGFGNYEFDRTFLAGGIRDIAQDVGYDFYVNNTMVAGWAIMQFFPIGSPAQHSAVDLESITNAVTNNILAFRMGETRGFNLKNRVEVVAGSLRDHWTDMNAADYIGIVSNVVNEPVVFVHGKGSIRVTNNTGGLASIGAELRFPLYSHTSLDMSETGTGKYDYLIHDTNTAIKRVNIRLRDVNLTWIEFYRAVFGGLVKCYDCTNQPDNDEWRTVSFPIGEESGIEAAQRAGDTKGHWYHFAGPGPFDWSQVDRIRLICSGANQNATDFFLLDGLNFSNTEVISIATDPAPIGGLRMLPVFRPDIRSQMELDVFSAWKLERTQYPLENLVVTAIGQTGSLYAGQSLDVNITGYIVPHTMYRIFELHHQVVKSSAESTQRGYTFLTEYNLIRHDIASGTQAIDVFRPTWARIPQHAETQRTKRQLRHGQQGEVW